MNSFGRIFRVSIFGESHGEGVGALLDGCPAGVRIDQERVRADMQRRQGGVMSGSTPRHESDQVHFCSGLLEGRTTGAPLLLRIDNHNVRSSDYHSIQDTPRPGHADWTARIKYGGYNDPRGGGHFSGRLTAALVAAGSVARQVIEPIEVRARLLEAGGSSDIDQRVQAALAEGDSVGGVVVCTAVNVPAGLGEPFFDSVEALISHAVFSIPAVKGIEFGSGFACARMRGSECNDEIKNTAGETVTNHAGGIHGGISNGNELTFRVAIKPTSSIRKTQTTVHMVSGEQVQLSVEGRHDACIALRVPVVLEAVTSIVLADLLLIEQKIKRVGV